jgi:hypothetical protein
VPAAVPVAAGFVSNRIDRLQEGICRLAVDLELAHTMGDAARQSALRRYGLRRFLDDWDRLLEEVAP